MQSIIHNALGNINTSTITIQPFDYRQMVDGMDVEEASGDLYDYGIKDDHLSLIYRANKDVVINVKTPHGLSAEYKLTK